MHQTLHGFNPKGGFLCPTSVGGWLSVAKEDDW